MRIMLHADDYGYNREVSRDILDCLKNGTLHGISIMPNSPYFEECMEMLGDVKVEKTIHFSISEGPSLIDKVELPLLVNNQGMFKLSFFKLLVLSIGPKRKELYRELKMELKAQYEKALPYLDEINVDSHVHYHMIPIVLKALLEVIEESGKQIGYVRIPAEPIFPFLKHKTLYRTYDFVNLIKNCVLNILYSRDKMILKRYSFRTAVFWGIIMSGHMDIDRVSELLPDFKEYSKKKNMDLEILAHPGRALSIETVIDPTNEEYAKAPLSENRAIEKDMFMRIAEYL